MNPIPYIILVTIIGISFLLGGCATAKPELGEPRCASMEHDEWVEVDCSTLEPRMIVDHILNGPYNE